MKIPKEQWKHFDKPSHLCVAEWCRFGRSTVIGEYVISTVGDYRSGVPSHLKMDTNADGAEWIGYQRFYETMVFKFDGFCTDKQCPCGGLPTISDYQELDFEGYQTEAESIAGHERMCEQWADTDAIVNVLTRTAQANGEYDAH